MLGNYWTCSYCGQQFPYGEMHTCQGVTFTVPGIGVQYQQNINTNLLNIIEILTRVERLLKRIEDNLERVKNYVR